MDSFEFNKIAAAILVTILLIIGVKELSNVVFYAEKPKQSAYKVEGVEINQNNIATKVKKVQVKLALITPLLVSADIDAGKNVFKKCAGCHSIDKGGTNKIGPALWSIVNKKVGSSDGYKYSSSLKSYDKNWSFEELNGFLHKPMAYIKGTKMGFAGLRKESDRANIIAYLNSKSDTPIPLK